MAQSTCAHVERSLREIVGRDRGGGGGEKAVRTGSEALLNLIMILMLIMMLVLMLMMMMLPAHNLFVLVICFRIVRLHHLLHGSNVHLTHGESAFYANTAANIT
jgi:hypothetical protein